MNTPLQDAHYLERLAARHAQGYSSEAVTMEEVLCLVYLGRVSLDAACRVLQETCRISKTRTLGFWKAYGVSA